MTVSRVLPAKASPVGCGLLGWYTPTSPSTHLVVIGSAIRSYFQKVGRLGCTRDQSLTAAQELESLLAQQRKSVALDWLSALLAREVDARKERAVGHRLKRAEFPEVTSLETFDWDFNPTIDRATIESLATLGFIERNEIALFLGKPGTGKTHLALAIGVHAVHRGFRVYCSSVKRLSAQIALARVRNNLDALFKRMLSARLWILDDWRVVSMKSEVSEEVFDLLDRRKHSTALILTSNRDIDEWGSVFPDPVLAGAAIDRLFDRANLVTFTGDSYRLKGKINLKNPILNTQTEE